MFGGLDYISSKAANCSSRILEEAWESTAKMHRNRSLAEKKERIFHKAFLKPFLPKIVLEGKRECRVGKEAAGPHCYTAASGLSRAPPSPPDPRGLRRACVWMYQEVRTNGPAVLAGFLFNHE